MQVSANLSPATVLQAEVRLRQGDTKAGVAAYERAVAETRTESAVRLLGRKQEADKACDVLLVPSTDFTNCCRQRCGCGKGTPRLAWLPTSVR